MAFFTILKYALAFFFGYFVFIMLGPVVFKTRYENPMWDDMPLSITAFGDMEYGIWVLFAIIIAAVIMIAGIVEANRNRALES